MRRGDDDELGLRAIEHGVAVREGGDAVLLPGLRGALLRDVGLPAQAADEPAHDQAGEDLDADLERDELGLERVVREPVGTEELEAVEVLSAKRESLLGRRLSLDEPTALSARVARTGAAEIVLGVPSANGWNKAAGTRTAHRRNCLTKSSAKLAGSILKRSRNCRAER